MKRRSLSRAVFGTLLTVTAVIGAALPMSAAHAAGGFGVEIDATAGGLPKVTPSGTEVHTITSAERTGFNLTDANLKRAVAAYFGKAPDDAYLSSPTPWGDLYKTYGWPQVTTTTVPRSATTTRVTSQTDILGTQEFKNNSNVPGDFNASITREVTDTVGSTWSNSSSFSVEATATVSAKVAGVGAEGSLTLGYSTQWGTEKSTSRTVTAGTTNGVSVRLEPGQAVTARLSATRGSADIRVTYEQTLSGYIAVNYSDPYQGHHFWALPVNEVLAAAGIARSQTCHNDISVQYYSNSVTELLNSNGKTMRRVSDRELRRV